MGESTDDLASSTSKLREEIKALTGVDIMADENTYKSTAEIITEIGSVWDKLSDVSKASTLEKLAGKTRASVVAGLLENYETINEVIESAEQADGSAIRENERFLDSIEGRIALFQNEVQKFWSDLISSDAIKGFVDFGTKLINFLDKTVGKLGVVKTAILGIVEVISIKSIKNGSGGRIKEIC